MNTEKFKYLLLESFFHSPTPSQEQVLNLLSGFLFEKMVPCPVFILEGYAGTGKTSLVSALSKILPEFGISTVLLAPTGRAAKVLSGYARKPASTIHRRLYKLRTNAGGTVSLALQPNLAKNTLFIVDEASMIPNDPSSSDQSGFSARSLLEDLITYTFSGKNCKLLFLGDPAQLPPVGSDQSPALDRDFLSAKFSIDITYFKLTDVIRQSLVSGILAEATSLRQKFDGLDFSFPFFKRKNHFPDFVALSGGEMLDCLQQCYSEYGRENTVVITRSNKRANQFNQGIRERVLFHDNEITAGDHLLVVRNNYFWLSPESTAGFIANGDIIELLNVFKYQELYGFRFAEATIRLTDYPNEPPFDVKLLLDTLHSEGPSLTFEDNQRLFHEVLADYADIPSRRKQYEQLRVNPFFNALQVKHAYALTCHKTQGGQWDAVFIDKSWLNGNEPTREHISWLYTAVTRATRKVFLVNFENQYFEP